MVSSQEVFLLSTFVATEPPKDTVSASYGKLLQRRFWQPSQAPQWRELFYREENGVITLLALSSFLIGAIIGASGVGGVLLIPALMFFGGLETHEAMATALFSFFFTGVVGTWIYHRYGSFDWKVTLPVLAGSFISSYAGAHVGSLATGPQLDALLAAIIILSSLYSMLSFKRAHLAEKLSSGQNGMLLFGIGLFTGFFCGMTGAGGGIISVPAMLIFGYAALPTIATSQVLQSIVSLSGSASTVASGFVMFSMVWWVTLCELAGVLVGVRIAHAVPVTRLKKSVTWICLCIGLIIGARAFLR